MALFNRAINCYNLAGKETKTERKEGRKEGRKK
jgi:hypothetical protein